MPVLGSTVGPKVEAPNPGHTGIEGVIVCVRSTDLAPFKVLSYVCQSRSLPSWDGDALAAHKNETISGILKRYIQAAPADQRHADRRPAPPAHRRIRHLHGSLSRRLRR